MSDSEDSKKKSTKRKALDDEDGEEVTQEKKEEEDEEDLIKVELKMTANNSNIQTDLEEIHRAINEIKRRQDNLDDRFTTLEKQQLISGSSLLNVTESHSIGKMNRNVALKNITKEENKRSTCFMCRARDEKCTLYFEDLYDFDKKQINTNIGADATRTRCPCGHLIRIHERNPNSSETNLPSFATPPLGQWLYEELVPPFVQDWIWSVKNNKSNGLNQSNKSNKED